MFCHCGEVDQSRELFERFYQEWFLIMFAGLLAIRGLSRNYSMSTCIKYIRNPLELRTRGPTLPGSSSGHRTVTNRP